MRLLFAAGASFTSEAQWTRSTSHFRGNTQRANQVKYSLVPSAGVCEGRLPTTPITITPTPAVTPDMLPLFGVISRIAGLALSNTFNIITANIFIVMLHAVIAAFP